MFKEKMLQAKCIGSNLGAPGQNDPVKMTRKQHKQTRQQQI